MKADKDFIVIDRQNGRQVFKLFSFTGDDHFNSLQRTNLYSLIWIKHGEGKLNADFSTYAFQHNTLFSFTPYQPFLFTGKKISGVALQYHADFYCIHRDQEETHCDTVVFNNSYQAPFIPVDKVSAARLEQTLAHLETELENKDDPDLKLLVPYLKIFLITATRIKSENASTTSPPADTGAPLVLRNLQNAIANNFKEKHTASEYAALLNISPNALSKLAKTHFNKTVTNLITERIIIEAKRELYLSSKPVKQIACKLGYDDEFYFSRLFKKWTGTSPKMYRDTVGFAKAEAAPGDAR